LNNITYWNWRIYFCRIKIEPICWSPRFIGYSALLPNFIHQVIHSFCE